MVSYGILFNQSIPIMAYLHSLLNYLADRRHLWYSWYGLRLDQKIFTQFTKQYASFYGHSSDLLHTSCGVPQGSIIGPQLFIIYVNDMCWVSAVLKFILFAYDTNVLFSQLPDTFS